MTAVYARVTRRRLEAIYQIHRRLRAAGSYLTFTVGACAHALEDSATPRWR
jgi:hypothetical protein